EYIRAMSAAEFAEACRPWLEQGPWATGAFDPAVFDRMAPLVQERVKLLSEVTGMLDFFFVDSPEMDPASWDKAVVKDQGAGGVLASAAGVYEACEWQSEAIKVATVAAGESLGRNLRKTQAPIRVAVTGRSVGPPLFESLEVLGRGRSIDRIKAALSRLSSGGK
ncbi:MAG: glutamate--tRNA ligase, partial [Acidimicrobiales bacterium]